MATSGAHASRRASGPGTISTKGSGAPLPKSESIRDWAVPSSGSKGTEEGRDVGLIRGKVTFLPQAHHPLRGLRAGGFRVGDLVCRRVTPQAVQLVEVPRGRVE